MSKVARREKKNIGGTILQTDLPPIDAASAAVVNVERLLLKLYRDEVARLAADREALQRFFRHIFKPLLEEGEDVAFATNFIAQPPHVVLGYARSSTDFPCFSIVLADENEEQNALGDFIGEGSEDNEEGADYEEIDGSLWASSYAVYVYAQHPDTCLYLYHFAKMVAMAGRRALASQGAMNVSLSGGELAPNEMYLPDHMFCRVLNVHCTAVQSVPRLTPGDARRARIVGLYRDDVVVDGVRGGVSTPESMTYDQAERQEQQASLIIPVDEDGPEW